MANHTLLQVRHEGKPLEFRRGSTPATITCLAFSPPALTPRLLAAASDHGTVHIFGLQGPSRWVRCESGGLLRAAGRNSCRPCTRHECECGCLSSYHALFLAALFLARPPRHRHPAAAAAKSLLSAVMPGVLEPQRPLATVRLPGKGQAAICALKQDEAEDGEGAAAARETRLAVATAGGLGAGAGGPALCRLQDGVVRLTPALAGPPFPH